MTEILIFTEPQTHKIMFEIKKNNYDFLTKLIWEKY